MFKALNGLSPSYLSGIISFWNPVCNLRNKENKLPNLQQAILNVVLVTSLLPKILIVKLASRLTRRIKKTSNFNYTIVMHTGDFTVSKYALCM